ASASRRAAYTSADSSCPLAPSLSLADVAGFGRRRRRPPRRVANSSCARPEVMLASASALISSSVPARDSVIASVSSSSSDFLDLKKRLIMLDFFRDRVVEGAVGG